MRCSMTPLDPYLLTWELDARHFEVKRMIVTFQFRRCLEYSGIIKYRNNHQLPIHWKMEGKNQDLGRAEWWATARCSQASSRTESCKMVTGVPIRVEGGRGEMVPCWDRWDAPFFKTRSFWASQGFCRKWGVSERNQWIRGFRCLSIETQLFLLSQLPMFAVYVFFYWVNTRDNPL